MNTDTNAPLAPGIYYDVPAARYHADPCAVPSLSSGVLRTMVDKSAAHAYLDHSRLGGKPRSVTPQMVVGLYVHALLADDAHTEFAVGEFEDYTTKGAKAFRDEAMAGGRTPILAHNAARAVKIADALRAKAAVGITVNPFENGDAEVTAIWKEGEAFCRARYDRMVCHDYLDIWDWKVTGVGVTPDALTRQIIDHGYHIQMGFYARGAVALHPEYAGRVSPTLCFVEDEAPFSVRRVVLSEAFRHAANHHVNHGINLWQHCTATAHWPEASDAITLSPPDWYLRKLEEDAT